MSKLGKVILPAVLVALMVLASSSSVFAATELAYDDDGAEGGLSASLGSYHAVKFSLPSGWSSARLLTASYYIESRPTNFRVHIYGSDGTTELFIPPLVVTPSGTGWFNVDLTDYNIIISGDFYVAAFYLVESTPVFGRDDTSPDSYTYDRHPPGGWVLETHYDEMIRAVVGPVGRPVGGALVTTSKLAVLSPYLALLGLVGAVTVAVALQRRKP